jgi:hypothetical protein
MTCSSTTTDLARGLGAHVSQIAGVTYSLKIINTFCTASVCSAQKEESYYCLDHYLPEISWKNINPIDS